MAISFLRIALLGLAPFTPLIAPRAGDKVLRVVPHADLKVLDPHTNTRSLVDRADPRMGVRRKDKDGVRLANKIKISDVSPPPGQKPGILLARNRLSDAEPHGSLPRVCAELTSGGGGGRYGAGD
jgi:hypothetical protein